jgi:tetratricopeptide (TPR) repeat protein
MRGRTKRLVARIGIGALGALGVLIVVALGTRMYGSVSGEEFAPDTFQRRSYRYYELPLLRIKVTPVRRTTITPELAEVLTDKGYLTTTTPPRRWDLVLSRRNGRFWQDGDARILCQYFDAYASDEAAFWLAWTSKNGALAKVLWPEIAKLARGDLYLLVPPLFQAAANATDAAAFRRDLDRVLARSYEQLAVTESKLTNLETAIRFYSEALRYEPNLVTAWRGRAACYESLGKTVKAERDRQQAAQLETDE